LIQNNLLLPPKLITNIINKIDDQIPGKFLSVEEITNDNVISALVGNIYHKLYAKKWSKVDIKEARVYNLFVKAVC